MELSFESATDVLNPYLEVATEAVFTLDSWREVALAIREADGYDQPRTAHATAERPIAPYYQGEDWLTLTLNHHAHGDFDLSTDRYRDHLAKHPGTPLVEGECMYEGLLSVESAGRRPVTDTMVRQVAYRAIQSGCCGYTYGVQGCWNAASERADGKSRWGDLPWYDGIDLPGADQLGHLRRLYEAVRWHRLRPFMECFKSEYELNNTAYAPRVTASAEMDTVVVYFGETFREGEGESVLSLLRRSPYLLRWFDPRSGELSVAEEPARTISGTLTIPAKPDGHDLGSDRHVDGDLTSPEPRTPSRAGCSRFARSAPWPSVGRPVRASSLSTGAKAQSTHATTHQQVAREPTSHQPCPPDRVNPTRDPGPQVGRRVHRGGPRLVRCKFQESETC